MCAKTSLNEKRLLTFSAFAAAGFALAGLVLGLLASSIVITFDGVYSLVSLLLTLLSLAAARYIESPAKTHFPFGKAMLEPAVIAIKGAVILIVVSYSIYSAVLALLNGGRPVDTSLATLFGFVSTLACGYVWWAIRQKSKRYSSGLIEAEAKQWKMDTLLSFVVMVGFVSAWLISKSPWAHLSVYADPAMMLAMAGYFVKVPFDMLKEAFRELLMMSPNKEIYQTVDQGVADVNTQTKQDIKLAGVTKIGRELRVNVDIHSTSNSLAVADVEKTRTAITRKLSKIKLDLQLTMNVAS
ncbi:cation diffusion facilitator family transporter [Vibrio sp. S4M6]|uniref:cation diffusion facilitator family transporter n=1 Tax=Vibrio sinus TaxID=2946865 RepID=UPI00202A437E|nr:cation diffusion facilitator family transporter [Vibrio sinus]MCL9780829.1 cation diffusion facilitator family transporter [Vibrio sinus]